MQNQLTDSAGRTWRLAITIAAIHGFEERTGIKLFTHLFDLWKRHRDTKAEPLEKMLCIIADLFPGVEEAASFVYECATIETGEKPNFTDFCATVSPIDCGAALVSLTKRLDMFMPEKPHDLKKAASKAAGPLGR